MLSLIAAPERCSLNAVAECCRLNPGTGTETETGTGCATFCTSYTSYTFYTFYTGRAGVVPSC